MVTTKRESCFLFWVYYDGKFFSVGSQNDGKGFFSMVVDPISTLNSALGASINDGKEFSLGLSIFHWNFPYRGDHTKFSLDKCK